MSDMWGGRTLSSAAHRRVAVVTVTLLPQSLPHPTGARHSPVRYHWRSPRDARESAQPVPETRQENGPTPTPRNRDGTLAHCAACRDYVPISRYYCTVASLAYEANRAIQIYNREPNPDPPWDQLPDHADSGRIATDPPDSKAMYMVTAMGFFEDRLPFRQRYEEARDALPPPYDWEDTENPYPPPYDSLDVARRLKDEIFTQILQVFPHQESHPFRSTNATNNDS